MNQKLKKKNKQRNDIIFNDKFLDLISKLNCLAPLPNEITKEIVESYKKQIGNIKPEAIDNEISKPGKAFPGMADFRGKPEDPYGDYIIYHEIIDYMKKEKKDALFLTYDTTKGDWMQKNKTPHLHYIENTYLNTEHTLYILDAERTFEDLLDISFKSLITNPENNKFIDLSSTITEYELTDFFNYNETTKNRNPGKNMKEFIHEITMNNINTIGDLQSLLLKAKPFFDKFKGEHLNQIGAARISLCIIDPNYKLIESDGKITSRYEKYKIYRE